MKWTGLAIAVAACGGGSNTVDLTGMYQVTADVGSMPCGTDQPVAMPPAYLKFQKMNLLGHDYYAFDGCSDAAGTMCDGSGGVFTAFSEPISGGWRGEVTSWSGNGGTCAITYDLRTAMLDNKSLAIDIEDHEGSVMVPDAQCTDAETKMVGPTLPCTMHESIDATKL
jgi:hypothetical protein